MKIAHVVTYISPDAAFGGPVRVAQGQAAALAARGHDVTVYAAAPIVEPEVSVHDGYALRLFPAKQLTSRFKFASMHAPALRRVLKAEADAFDVAHIHLARDLVTLPAARAFRIRHVPYVAQTHGMIVPHANLLSRPIDLWQTRKALAGASKVLVLTDAERRALEIVEPRAQTVPVRNGIRLATLPTYDGRQPVVLFLARLHARKRPLQFVHMAEHVARECPEATFLIAGPDEGELSVVQTAIAESPISDRITYLGSVAPEATSELMQRASVYVLPSIGEVFPMSLLEAFAAGTPAVVTDSLGIADKCTEYGAARVSSIEPEALAAAVVDILRSRELAEAIRSGAETYLRSELSIDSVAADLERLYGD